MQDFSKDHDLVAKGEAMTFPSAFTVKSILTGILSFLCFESLWLYPVHMLVRQLTYWGLFSTTLLMIISLKCSFDEQIHKKRGWLRAHHVLFEVFVPLNLLITTVYYSVLVGPVIASCNGDYIWMLHSYLIHIVPLASTILLYSVTDIVMVAEHAKVLFPIGIVYGFYNYYVVASTGELIYWFLTWEDLTSPLIIIGLDLACYAFFSAMSYTTRQVRLWRYKKWIAQQKQIDEQTKKLE